MIEEIKYLVIDVDGVMTDSGIYYDNKGNELKKFCTKDAAGFVLAKEAGIQIVVLTGRECGATIRRMQELHVTHLYQNVNDKMKWLEDFMRKKMINKENLGYIGDDLNDLSAMKLAGYVACPSDSCKEVIMCADYVSEKKGGTGVVRDVVEVLLKEYGKWEQTVKTVYIKDSGI